jgi:UDP-glucose 4-epimerase
MGQSILVTGNKGYIGSHLLYHVSRLKVPIYYCDLEGGLDFGVMRGYHFDYVIHLAAHASVTQSMLDPDECFENNAFKLIPFLQYNKIGKLIFTSTGGAIYGNKLNAKEEDASWNGCISPYGQSKYLAEKIIRRMHPNHCILRLGNVWGGQDSDRLELAMHARFAKDNPIVVYGGTQIRDFIHVETVCKAIMRAIKLDVTGTFNLGDGQKKIKDIAEEYAAKRNADIRYAMARPGEIDKVSLDSTRAHKAGLLS